ncbi:hypothetical protein ACFQL0_09785 [Haloplanus litoreus]
MVGTDLRAAAVATDGTVALTLVHQFGFGVTTSPCFASRHREVLRPSVSG